MATLADVNISIAGGPLVYDEGPLFTRYLSIVSTKGISTPKAPEAPEAPEPLATPEASATPRS
jgi:hypothetical protein